jgi:hypothetical protein
MQGSMARVRGPFTPPQWIELEHQALIYKYLSANSPVPHSLLVPIRRSGSLASSPYPPPYFGTSTCKRRKRGGRKKQRRPRVLSAIAWALASVVQFHHAHRHDKKAASVLSFSES